MATALPWWDESTACLAAFAVAAVTAALAVLLVRPLAHRLGAIDVPGGRHAHRAPTARFGGLAILAALLLAAPLALQSLGLPLLGNRGHTLPILGIGLGVCLLGARDDVRPLRPSHKLLGLAAAAVALVMNGIYVQFVELPWIGRIALESVGGIVTVFWVLACTNAVNLVDGVDGLGAGVALVAATVLALLAVAMGDLESAILLFALAGACAGFLLHNREPARIFLGDSGSLLLGYMLAAISVSGSTKRATAVFLVAALCALAVPLFDSTHAFVRRFRKAFTVPGQRRIWRAVKATAVGDREHLHHRLLVHGMSHRQVARAVSLTTLATSLAALLLLPTGDVGSTTICGGLLAAGYVLYRLAAPRRPAVVIAEPEVVLMPVTAPPAEPVVAAAGSERDILLPTPAAHPIAQAPAARQPV